ncbi:MAG: cysteine desulfurase [Bacilli bacterium]|nr:cysteine desulfurase [Bacilli bacterium]
MIYLDYSATTPVDKKVLDTYNKVCLDYPGNSNSLHKLGIEAKELEEYATKRIEELLKLKNKEIIYTSGASESNNHAIKGICFKYKNRGTHIISTKLEHSSIKTTLDYIESKGFNIDYVKLKDNGEIDLEDLKRLLQNNNTLLISISAVDSELGIKQPISEIKKILKSYPKCFFHVDYTQALGKIEIDMNDSDLASISLHKIYGLKGIGLLIKNKNIVISPLIHGGKSTTIYRSGTPALPLIVSSMKAIELIIPNINDNYIRVSKLNKLIKDKLNTYKDIHINSTESSIPHILNISIDNIKPETFIHALDEKEIYLGTKSACSTINTMSDSVYEVTKNKDLAMHSIRISLSYLTKEEEISTFLNAFDECYKKLKM